MFEKNVEDDGKDPNRYKIFPFLFFEEMFKTPGVALVS